MTGRSNAGLLATSAVRLLCGFGIINVHAHQMVGSKKLKCSGGQPTCGRCLRENIICIYSAQKQMGRPKKRQRAGDDGDEEVMIDHGLLDRNDSSGSGTLSAEHPTGLADGVSYSNNTMPGMGSTASDSAFALDEMLQPWTVPNDMNWILPDEQAFENPGLTRDNSSHDSPPALNLPPELMNIPQTINQHHHTPPDRAPQSHNTDQLPSCACLSTLYLTLSNLATMDPSFSFPTALHPLRQAMSTASVVIACPICPTRFITGLQNVQLLNALLMSLAERFSRILTSITAETKTLEQANSSLPSSHQKTKTFRLADLSTPGHMHTGGLSCAAAFSLSFTPAEWRSMAKKAVRAEVYGPADGESDGNDCRPHLLGLIGSMEKRQDRWHRTPCAEDFPKDKEGNYVSRKFGGTEGGDGREKAGSNGEGQGHEEGEHLCLKMLAGTRRMVEGFDWD